MYIQNGFSENYAAGQITLRSSSLVPPHLHHPDNLNVNKSYGGEESYTLGFGVGIHLPIHPDTMMCVASARPVFTWVMTGDDILEWEQGVAPVDVDNRHMDISYATYLKGLRISLPLALALAVDIDIDKSRIFSATTNSGDPDMLLSTNFETPIGDAGTYQPTQEILVSYNSKTKKLTTYHNVEEAVKAGYVATANPIGTFGKLTHPSGEDRIIAGVHGSDPSVTTDHAVRSDNISITLSWTLNEDELKALFPNSTFIYVEDLVNGDEKTKQHCKDLIDVAPVDSIVFILTEFGGRLTCTVFRIFDNWCGGTAVKGITEVTEANYKVNKQNSEWTAEYGSDE